MTADDMQSPRTPQPGSTTHVTTTETRASKRTEIGLAPDRETAPQSVQRPPDADNNLVRWLAVLCLSLLGLAVLFLIVARLLTPDTTWASMFAPRRGSAGAAVATVQTGAASVATAASSSVAALAPPGYTLYVRNDFNGAGAATGEQRIEGQMVAGEFGNIGVYRIQAWPSQVGWTLIDPGIAAYRMETSATLDPAVPAAVVGMVARFAGPGNFYLFGVDGAGAVTAQLWKDGKPLTVQALTASGIARPAGQPNRLVLEDDGTALRFYVNEVLASTIPEPLLAPSRPGLAVVNTGASVATADFDWVAFYQPVK